MNLIHSYKVFFIIFIPHSSGHPLTLLITCLAFCCCCDNPPSPVYAAHVFTDEGPSQEQRGLSALILPPENTGSGLNNEPNKHPPPSPMEKQNRT